MVKETSCGAVVYQWKDMKREFLLIKHLKGKHIGFPKGHVEKDEKPWQTAKREIYEETGVLSYIYKNNVVKTNYQPTTHVDKTVFYFIGKPINTNLKRQESEVSEVFWLAEDEVLNALTFQGDKEVFNQLLLTIKQMESHIPQALINYVEEDILPQYDNFDEGHHRDHIYAVVEASFALAKQYNVRKDMAYIIACYHDLGLQFGRETHHITSGDLLLNDSFICSYFTNEECQLMQDAIFDHRASNEHEPRTMYGKILAEADRLLDVETVILRTVLYELHHFPKDTIDENINRAANHIVKKYGKKGYLRRYLDYIPNQIGEKALIALSSNRALLEKTLKKVFKTHKNM